MIICTPGGPGVFPGPAVWVLESGRTNGAESAFHP